MGAASLLDPQTGHYTTELPIAPEMLSEPVIHTGASNALLGFNSSVGTVGYSWSKMTQGGSITVGAGDHDLNFQRLHMHGRHPMVNPGIGLGVRNSKLRVPRVTAASPLVIMTLIVRRGCSTPWPRIPNRFVCRLSGKVFWLARNVYG